MPISEGSVPAALPGGSMDDEKKWMAGAVKHPGGLHRALGIPEDEKIPAAKVEAATHSRDPHVRRMASLAKVFAFHRPGAKTAFRDR